MTTSANLATLVVWLLGAAVLFLGVRGLRRREMRLVADAERYRTIADRTDDWEYWEGPDGGLRYISPSCERITGYPPEAFLADPGLLCAIVHPDDRPLFERHSAEVRATTPRVDAAPRGSLEFRILTRDGQIRWIGHHCTHFVGPHEPYPGHRASNRDITPRKQSEFGLERTTRLLDSVRSAQALYLSETPSSQVFRALLDTLVTLTDSQYGFLDEVLVDANGTYKLSLALSDISWDEASHHLYAELVARNLEFRNLGNLAGAPVTTGQLVIANDPPHDPRSGGLPPGHPPLHGYLGMPIYFGSELVGVAGIANRPGGYDEELATWLEPFLGTCATIIHSMRLERRRQQAEAALWDANYYNRGLLEASLDPLVVIDATGHISDVNAATEQATGYPRERLIGTDFASYFSDPAAAQAGYRKVFDQGGVRDYALELMHRDGRATPVLYNASVYRDHERGTEQVFAAARDITAIKRLTDMLKARLRLLDQADGLSLVEILRASVDEAAALTESAIGFYHFLEPDQETLTLQTWSTRTTQEFCQAQGEGLHYPLTEAGVWADCVRQRQAVIHNDYAALPHRRGMPPGHAQVTRELVVPVFRGERIVAILGVGNKPHDYGKTDLNIVATFADLAWDIVEQKRAQNALRELAHFDALTGLPNRVLLADRLKVALARARRERSLLAVCYLDLDGFKPVNDTYGHAAGDRLLVAVAERMAQSLREGDTVARLGGDEFVLLLENMASLEQCEQTLRRLQAAIAEPYAINPTTQVRVSASIGMTLYPLDPADADTLLRHADLAMYQAKQAGRHCVRCFSPD